METSLTSSRKSNGKVSHNSTTVRIKELMYHQLTNPCIYRGMHLPTFSRFLTQTCSMQIHPLSPTQNPLEAPYISSLGDHISISRNNPLLLQCLFLLLHLGAWAEALINTNSYCLLLLILPMRILQRSQTTKTTVQGSQLRNECI